MWCIFHNHSLETQWVSCCFVMLGRAVWTFFLRSHVDMVAADSPRSSCCTMLWKAPVDCVISVGEVMILQRKSPTQQRSTYLSRVPNLLVLHCLLLWCLGPSCLHVALFQWCHSAQILSVAHIQQDKGLHISMMTDDVLFIIITGWVICWCAHTNAVCCCSLRSTHMLFIVLGGGS